MAELNYNMDEVPDSSFDDLPEGTYLSAITSSEWKPTKDGSTQYLALTFQVLEGEKKGRLFWLNLNLKHHKDEVITIAKQQLKSISDALGIKGLLKDSCQLHDQPLKVVMQRNKNGDVVPRKFLSILAAGPKETTTTGTRPWLNK